MLVQDIMIRNVKACGPDTNLAAACEMLLNNDIGVLPVVGNDGNLNGIVTDRDICIALGTRDRRPSEIPVHEVISGNLFTCAPNDDIHRALDVMKEHKVRRVPVTDNQGVLRGIISMNDIVLKAERSDGQRRPELSYEDVIETMKVICGHTVQQAAAST